MESLNSQEVMSHYVDIALLPDAEISVSVLMNAVYSKLHKALCDLRSTAIGVSFPRYEVTLGNLLRIHGAEADLARLQQVNWLGGMAGYCSVSAVLAVPNGVKFRTVSRKRSTMSQSKLRRLVSRRDIADEDVKRYKVKMLETSLVDPYLELTSASTGQKYRRHVEFGPLLDEPVAGVFDQFGQSRAATIPWF